MNIAEKTIGFFKKERIITKVCKETSKYLVNMFNIPKEEKILVVLDDSFLKNLKQMVVFTNKNIYWNINNSYIKIISDGTESSNRGQGTLCNKLLKNASVFSKNDKNVTVVYIISENIQLILPFAYFQNDNSLSLAFYDHLSNNCRGYKPNDDINGKIFSKLKNVHKIVSVNIVSAIFNILSYVVALIFIINLIAQYFIISNEVVIYSFVLFKAFSIILGNRKSFYFNLLLIIITPLIVNWLNSDEPYNFEASVCILYSCFFILLGIFDFDKIFKYLAFILAISSILYMMGYIFILGR